MNNIPNGLTVGVCESDGSLSSATFSSGLGDLDAVAGFDVVAEQAGGGGGYAVVPNDVGSFGGVAVAMCVHRGVRAVGTGRGQSKEGGEDDLRFCQFKKWKYVSECWKWEYGQNGNTNDLNIQSKYR